MRQAETQLGSSHRGLGGGLACFGMGLASTTLSRWDETGAAAVLLCCPALPCPVCYRLMTWMMMMDRSSLLLILLHTWQNTPWRRVHAVAESGVNLREGGNIRCPHVLSLRLFLASGDGCCCQERELIRSRIGCRLLGLAACLAAFSVPKRAWLDCVSDTLPCCPGVFW